MKKISILICFSLFYFSSLVAQDNMNNNYVIKIIGDANVIKSVNDNGKIPANTGIGINYFKIFKKNKFNENIENTNKLSFYKWLHDIEMTFSLNVASTVDTLKPNYNGNIVSNKTDFGNSILNPTNSGQSFSLSARGYFGKYIVNRDTTIYNDWLGVLSGFYVNVSTSNRNWSDSNRVLKASTGLFEAGFFYDFMDYTARPNKSLYIGLGYTGRFILGDIALDGNDNFRKNLLGSSKLNYSGFEAIAGAKFENIKLEVRVPFFSKKDNAPGLSGTQPNYQIGFTGGITIK